MYALILKFLILRIKFKGAHFATYPPALIKPCILAGCPINGIVVDPFMGSGTTAQVCIELDRNFVGIELNPEYKKFQDKRIHDTCERLLAEMG
jgi:DNA modification methylase